MEEYLRSFKLFTEKEIAEVLGLAVPLSLRKNDFLIKEGQVCKSVAFIRSGIFRSFYYSSSGEEITYCFISPQNFIAAYSSFISGEKTSENMQALAEADLLLIPKREISRLESRSTNWLRFMKMMAEQQYLELEKRIYILQKEKAEKRYQDLLEKHPEYLQSIPLNYLASYLGITQRHLSRIRKEMSI